ncbi:dihydrolipoamide acetyltransferase family protein [Kineococcus sp. SYSU DK005]|uniref:dihydrolipoamide acetyltransferase family protein n=1 Tax=Kineococcus sp. SYSU DK005 TaxID=3383126 RepID=UPI003D7D9694
MHQRFALPDVGEGLTEAEIVSWKVRAGDTVAVNDVLVEIETAKSLVELPSPYAGTVVDLLVAEGSTVDVGTDIVVIGDGAAAATGGAAPAGGAQDAAGGAPGGQDAHGAQDAEASGATLVGYGTREGAARRRRPAARPTSAPATTGGTAGAAGTPASTTAPATPAAPASRPGQVLAKPPVRKLARDLGVELTDAVATGPGGTVTRADVLALVPSAPAEPPRREDRRERERHVPIRGVRKATAQAMVESAFSAPHVTVFTTVDATRTMKLVRRLKEDPEFAGVRVSPLLLVAKALLVAVRRNPDINSTWDEQNQVIVVKNYVNLGIAVATPRGLLVPNVKDADAMSLKELAENLGELAATARAGKTQPRELAEGTITVTNVGTFGIDTGTPILNRGEAAILAVGKIAQKPWVHKGKVKPRYLATLSLSFDHRMLDGESGSRALADVAAVLEDPARALTWS